MSKKFWVGVILVFIAWNVLNIVIHGILLTRAYESDAMMKVFRPDMQSKMWIFYIVAAVCSFFLTLIFSKWYKGRGLVEGVQFGVYSGFLMATPMAYSSYAMYPIPSSVVFQWFVYGMIHYLIIGVILGLIFGKKEIQAAAPPAA